MMFLHLHPSSLHVQEPVFVNELKFTVHLSTLLSLNTDGGYSRSTLPAVCVAVDQSLHTVVGLRQLILLQLAHSLHTRVQAEWH